MSIREKLEAAFENAFPYQDHTGEDDCVGCGWLDQSRSFRRLLGAEAWLDAAMMLVPDNWTGFVPVRGGDGEEAWLWPVDGTMNKGHRTTAPTPAGALLAAIQKARTA